MELMWAYSLFAITTALVSMYELIIPVINQLPEDHNMSQYRWLTYIVFFIMSLVLAPVMFPNCIVPFLGDTFRTAMLASLLDKKI